MRNPFRRRQALKQRVTDKLPEPQTVAKAAAVVAPWLAAVAAKLINDRRSGGERKEQ